MTPFTIPNFDIRIPGRTIATPVNISLKVDCIVDRFNLSSLLVAKSGIKAL